MAPSPRPASWPLNSALPKTYFAMEIVMLFLASFAVALRFYARKMKGIKLSWDDWLAFSALVCFWGHIAVGFYAIFAGGCGHHKSDLTPGEITAISKQLVIIQFPFALEMCLVRCSICALVIRIFVQKWLRWCIWAAMAVNIAWALFLIISTFFICQPFAYNWNKSIPGGHCLNATSFFIGLAGWGSFNDVVIFVLPLAVVWKLHMSREEKIAISGIFALGFLDVVVSILRIPALLHIRPAGDFPYDVVQAQIWSLIEPSVAIIVACAPLCRVVLSKVMPSKTARKTTTSSNPSSCRTLQGDGMPNHEMGLVPSTSAPRVEATKILTAESSIGGGGTWRRLLGRVRGSMSRSGPSQKVTRVQKDVLFTEMSRSSRDPLTLRRDDSALS